MLRRLLRAFRKRRTGEIDPDEIFIDSSNLPHFDTYQFEGRIEQPISRKMIGIVSILFAVIGVLYISRFWFLQVRMGEVYAEQSEQNRLHETDIIANRGVIFDRNGLELASNATYDNQTEFARRAYATTTGIAHVLGYVKYPTKDSAGFYYRDSYIGEDGIEKYYHDILSGKNGVRIVETDARGRKQSQSMTRSSQDGESVKLTIDARLSNKMYEIMEKSSNDYGFTGGAGVIMDVHTGDVISLVSYPEYSSSVMAEGDSKAIAAYQTSPKKPFLNRAVSGLYTPGSIIKPLMALAALNEGLISPNKSILSTGSISIPNPYYPDLPTIFRDWKAHGWVDMREALAVSSNVYFFAIGGGYEDQKGLGIARIEKYLRMFGLAQKTGIKVTGEKEGTIPNPEWKAKVFDGDVWRVGDTYNTSIGQYGVQFTPLQVARYIAAIANGGTLHTPRLMHEEQTDAKKIDIPSEYFNIVREGMRLSTTEGTTVGINVPYVVVAAKSGTAELGARKDFVNSSVAGFFPYENPKYAFAIIMERGPRSNLIGATYVMRQLLDWMNQNTPEYFE